MASLSEFDLRMVTKDDIDLLFAWANDSQVRKNAFHTEKISYEEHRKWFSKLINDQSQIQYIFMLNGEPVGQIRFSISEDEAKIDYSIAPTKRGNGYGRIMLKLAQEEFLKTYPTVKTLIGQVKTGNHSSEKCFTECGFDEVFSQFELRIKE